MSNKTLEIVKKYLVDTLGVNLVEAQKKELLDVALYNAHLDGKIIVISISGPFISLVENSDNIYKFLEDLRIVSFLKENPGKNISLYDLIA